jgi:hypothetical protein
MSPSGAASAIGSTSKPSISASSPHGIDLTDDDARAHPTRPRRDAPAAPAVAGYHEGRGGQQDVCRTEDAVQRILAGPVAVVEHPLGGRVVQADHREAQAAFAGQRAHPNHAGGGLLDPGHGRADLRSLVEHSDQVGAVVHDEVRVGCQDGLQVPLVGRKILTVPGLHGDLLIGDQRGADVVLGRERVGGAEGDLGAAGPQRAEQDCRLGGDVERGGDPIAS